MIPAEYHVPTAGRGLLLAMALAGTAGWFTNGWRHGAEIAKLQRAHAEFRATLSEAALADVPADAATIRQAATEFATIQSTLAHVGAHQGAAQCKTSACWLRA